MYVYIGFVYRWVLAVDSPLFRCPWNNHVCVHRLDVYVWKHANTRVWVFWEELTSECLLASDFLPCLPIRTTQRFLQQQLLVYWRLGCMHACILLCTIRTREIYGIARGHGFLSKSMVCATTSKKTWYWRHGGHYAEREVTLLLNLGVHLHYIHPCSV